MRLCVCSQLRVLRRDGYRQQPPRKPSPVFPFAHTYAQPRRAGSAGTGRGLLICDFVFSSTVTPKTRSDDTSCTFFGAAVRGYSLASPARLDSLTSGWTIGVEKPLNLHLCALTDKWGTKKEKKKLRSRQKRVQSDRLCSPAWIPNGHRELLINSREGGTDNFTFEL